ncbi:MAG: hypothetical protein FJ398_12910 [Verrucomicrobia bacterium]|nr:hypothetical protein [Verrucomicrobiota bacterium]
MFSVNLLSSNRREFFRLTVRAISVAALGGVAVLATKSHLPRALREVCLKKRICTSCGAFADCALPRALAARERKNGA